MEVAGLPSRVHEVVGSKRRLDSEDDTPAKRRQRPPSNRKSATRPMISGELLWGPPYIESLYCSEKDKDTFRIHFRRRRTEAATTEAKSPCQASRRSIVKLLKRYGKARSKAMVALLESSGLWPRRPRRPGQEPQLHLRYGGTTLVVDADGIFQVPPRGLVVTVADFEKMADRRLEHPLTLLPEAKGEKKEFGERRAEEHHRIQPKQAEEDTQIALMMAAMAQEMLRSADRKQRADQKQPGVWARVIGMGGGKIYMYRSWVPRRFVETFKADKRFVIEYRCISLEDEDRVIEQLDCLLKERSPPSVQPGAAAAA